MLNSVIDYAKFEQVCAPRKTEKISKSRKIRLTDIHILGNANVLCCQANTKFGGKMNILSHCPTTFTATIKGGDRAK